jgi:hypothetical protein
VDWPGWSRSGKTEEEALDRLAQYASRYATVARLAGHAFPASMESADFRVAERLKGNATTDFGAPSAVSKADAENHNARQAKRITELLQAAWDHLDNVIAGAPASLRKGPRGGGRDRDKVHEHVISAEFEAYAPTIGVRVRVGGIEDRAGIRAGHAAIIEAIVRPVDDPGPKGKRWPPAYMARRTAWHALDHAWEIEDRTE